MTEYLPHHLSNEATKTELDLFSIPSTQIAIKESTFIQIFPITSTENQTVIEFQIKGKGEEFLDPSQIYLHVKANIQKNDGTPISEKDKIIPTNGLFHAMFNDVCVNLGDKQLTHPDQGYAYKAFFHHMLMENPHAIHNYANLELFHKEPFYDHIDNELWESNKLIQKKQMINGVFDMCGKLDVDIFNQDKLLPNFLDMSIKLFRSKNEFCLNRLYPVLDEMKLTSYSLNIKSISLFVRKVKIGDIYMDLMKNLKQQTFKYPILRSEIRTRNLLQHSREVYLDNIFLGNLPSFILFGIVENDTQVGNYVKNPFYFPHCNLNYCSVQVNSQSFPLVPLEPNFKLKESALCYQHFLINIGKYYGTDGVNISYEDFNNGCTLYPFDLTADQNFGLNHFNLTRNGNIRIVLKFSEALKNPSVLIIYALYQSVIEIDSSENIILDY